MTWSGLNDPADLLVPGARAPLRMPRETALAYKKALATLVEGPELPGGTAEAALSTGATLLHGAQELMYHCGLLVRPGTPRQRLAEVTKTLSLTCLALSRTRDAAYVLQQVAEILRAARGAPPAGLELPRPSRLRDLMTPLEAVLEPLALAPHLEADRLGVLCVRLDELYDDAALALSRLHQLAALPLESARALAPEMLRRLHAELAKASFADNLLAQHEQAREEKPEPGQGSGLLELLPELLRALEAEG